MNLALVGLPLSYRAFISYSHADTSWARWLHRALESFRIDKDLAGGTTEVGLHAANAFGLHDMHGNALEWVEDCVGNYQDTPVNGSAWMESDCKDHIFRGGAWYSLPEELDSAQRFWGHAPYSV